MVAQIFGIAVTIVILGWLWFFVVRPILEDYKVIRPTESVKNYERAAPIVTSPILPSKQEEAPQQRAGIKPPIPLSGLVSGTDTADFDLAAVPSDLTYEEVVAILAGQMTPAGKPAYSGKKIYGLVGGNYNDFTALMRRLRVKDEAPAEPPESVTPIAGRVTRAGFREVDPELSYQPLE